MPSIKGDTFYKCKQSGLVRNKDSPLDGDTFLPSEWPESAVLLYRKGEPAINKMPPAKPPYSVTDLRYAPGVVVAAYTSRYSSCKALRGMAIIIIINNEEYNRYPRCTN